nr:DNA topoisomerase 3-beta isoform X1 [Tanacetum cinerariifolium]
MSLRRGSSEVHEFDGTFLGYRVQYKVTSVIDHFLRFLFLSSKASLNIIYILTLNYTWFSKVANNADEFFCREMSRCETKRLKDWKNSRMDQMLVYDMATILRMLGVEHRTADFDMDHAKLKESGEGQLMGLQGAFNRKQMWCIN